MLLTASLLPVDDPSQLSDLSSMKALRLNSETFPPTSAEIATLDGAGIAVEFAELVESSPSLALLPSIDALLVVSDKVKRSHIDKLDSCRVIVRYGSGTDNVDIDRATELGIIVANVPDFCLSEVADHTMALLLATARKLRLMDIHTRSGNWQARTQVNVRRISGRTLGLVGFGAIARLVARRAIAFDMKVIAFDPFLDRNIARSLGVAEVRLEEVLTQADFLSLHVPLNDKTFHLIGEEQLKAMKSGSVLLNTGRGGLVDEEALVKALLGGQIAGAGIDVYETLPMFDPKPTFVDHPLFALDNVLLTPHTAGVSVESLEQLMLDGARQAIDVLNGGPPQHWVNPVVVPRIPLNI
jgi:D-3-phosphoglycerate dehydrogenase